MRSIQGTISATLNYGGFPPSKRFGYTKEVLPQTDVPGSQSTTVELDANVQTDTGATKHDEYQLAIDPSKPNAELGDAIYTAKDPSIATVNSQGRTNRVSDGEADFLIRATKTGWNQGVKNLDHSQTSPATVRTLLNYVSGSLAEETSTTIDTLISGMTGTDAEKLIRSGGVYHQSCWTYPLRQQLTCFSRGIPRLTLVTPRNAVGAEHFPQQATVRRNEFVSTCEQWIDDGIGPQPTIEDL